MAQEERPYRVTGYIYLFGGVVGKVDGVTTAVSKKKALSNMLYRYKRSHGYLADSGHKISAQADPLY